jgi:hypothetical protein
MAALAANGLADPSRQPASALTPPFYRCALESLPLPALIFEATNRLNFINGPARSFFGLNSSPDAFGWSAEDFFGSGIDLRDAGGQEGDKSESDCEHRGLWGERRRVLLCCRKGTSPVKVSVAISSFRPPNDYFSLPHASVSGHVFSPSLPDAGTASPPVQPVPVEVFTVILLDAILTQETQVSSLPVGTFHIGGHPHPLHISLRLLSLFSEGAKACEGS